VLQYPFLVAVRGWMLQGVAVYCRALQGVAV